MLASHAEFGGEGVLDDEAAFKELPAEQVEYYRAAALGDIETVQRLYPTYWFQKDNLGRHVLFYAAQGRQGAIAEYLLRTYEFHQCVENSGVSENKSIFRTERGGYDIPLFIAIITNFPALARTGIAFEVLKFAVKNGQHELATTIRQASLAYQAQLIAEYSAPGYSEEIGIALLALLNHGHLSTTFDRLDMIMKVLNDEIDAGGSVYEIDIGINLEKIGTIILALIRKKIEAKDYDAVVQDMCFLLQLGALGETHLQNIILHYPEVLEYKVWGFKFKFYFHGAADRFDAAFVRNPAEFARGLAFLYPQKTPEEYERLLQGVQPGEYERGLQKTAAFLRDHHLIEDDDITALHFTTVIPLNIFTGEPVKKDSNLSIKEDMMRMVLETERPMSGVKGDPFQYSQMLEGTPFSLALMQNYRIAIPEMLKMKGALREVLRIDVVTGYTRIHEAVLYKKPVMLQMLIDFLQEKAPREWARLVEDPSENAFLRLAKEINDPEINKVLKEAQAAPLIIAVKNKNLVKVSQYLLEESDVEIQRQAFFLAAETGWLEGVRHFLASGWSERINEKRNRDDTVLHAAAAAEIPLADKRAVITELLAKGADPRLLNKSSKLPHQLAHFKRYEDPLFKRLKALEAEAEKAREEAEKARQAEEKAQQDAEREHQERLKASTGLGLKVGRGTPTAGAKPSGMSPSSAGGKTPTVGRAKGGMSPLARGIAAGITGTASVLVSAPAPASASASVSTSASGAPDSKPKTDINAQIQALAREFENLYAIYLRDIELFKADYSDYQAECRKKDSTRDLGRERKTLLDRVNSLKGKDLETLIKKLKACITKVSGPDAAKRFVAEIKKIDAFRNIADIKNLEFYLDNVLAKKWRVDLDKIVAELEKERRTSTATTGSDTSSQTKASGDAARREAEPVRAGRLAVAGGSASSSAATALPKAARPPLPQHRPPAAKGGAGGSAAGGAGSHSSRATSFVFATPVGAVEPKSEKEKVEKQADFAASLRTYLQRLEKLLPDSRAIPALPLEAKLAILYNASRLFELLASNDSSLGLLMDSRAIAKADRIRNHLIHQCYKFLEKNERGEDQTFFRLCSYIHTLLHSARHASGSISALWSAVNNFVRDQAYFEPGLMVLDFSDRRSSPAILAEIRDHALPVLKQFCDAVKARIPYDANEDARRGIPMAVTESPMGFTLFEACEEAIMILRGEKQTENASRRDLDRLMETILPGNRSWWRQLMQAITPLRNKGGHDVVVAVAHEAGVARRYEIHPRDLFEALQKYLEKLEVAIALALPSERASPWRPDMSGPAAVPSYPPKPEIDTFTNKI